VAKKTLEFPLLPRCRRLCGWQSSAAHPSAGQGRGNKNEACSMYSDVAQQFDTTEITHVDVFYGPKIHSVPLSGNGEGHYGMKESALRSDLSCAYPGLFKVSTRKNQKVAGGSPEICLNKPS
jgi:hypothetical protein